MVLNQKDHTLNFSLDLSGANVFQSIYFGGKLFIVSWSFVLLFEVICALLPSKTDTLLLITDPKHLLKDVYSKKSTEKISVFMGN